MFTSNISKWNNRLHPYHIVEVSPWPAVASILALCLLFRVAYTAHAYSLELTIILFSSVLFTLVLASYYWWRDIVREGSYEGVHSLFVQEGLRSGVLFFIVSEVMVFFGFFWAFFHSSIAPTFDLDLVWPPEEVNTIGAWGIPFLNTMILLSSGASLTWTHSALLGGSRKDALFSLAITIVLAAIFTFFQGIEYSSSVTSISDSVYGTTFYLLTGLHGFHVLVGAIFLAICLKRMYNDQFTSGNHIGFEAAAWYWHFVDVVWLFLFAFVYAWSDEVSTM